MYWLSVLFHMYWLSVSPSLLLWIGDPWVELRPHTLMVWGSTATISPRLSSHALTRLGLPSHVSSFLSSMLPPLSVSDQLHFYWFFKPNALQCSHKSGLVLGANGLSFQPLCSHLGILHKFLKAKQLFPIRGYSVLTQETVWVSTMRGVHLTSGGQRLAMLLNVSQYTGQALTTIIWPERSLMLRLRNPVVSF